MNRRRFSVLIGTTAALLAVLLLAPLPARAQSDWLRRGLDLMGSDRPAPAQVGEPAEPEIRSGLKEALRVGTERVVGQLGQTDGFYADPAVHIPLPERLEQVRSALGTVGMAGMMDDLELKLNRAAETATPRAKQLFWQSIEEMTLEDVQEIYNGPEDAATRYFEGKMSEPLAAEMRPVVSESLAEVGAVQSYNAALGRYRDLPFVPDVQTDLTGYVVEKGMDGIFHYLALEEAAIRQDPAKRTTELLQKVFGK